MYWFRRPPYLRWAAATLIVVAAAVMDFRRTPTTTHPFLTEKVEAGAAIGAGDLAWRRVPEGLLPLPDLLEPVAASDLAAGEPLLPSHLATEVVVPEGWWVVSVPLPGPAAPGAEVQVIVTDPAMTVPGIVLRSPEEDGFSFERPPALVAVPGQAAPLVAAASAQGLVVVLLAP